MLSESVARIPETSANDVGKRWQQVEGTGIIQGSATAEPAPSFPGGGFLLSGSQAESKLQPNT